MIQFRNVQSGTQFVENIGLRNNGNGSMQLGPIQLESADPEFSIAFEDGSDVGAQTVFAPGQQKRLVVTYSPTDDEPDTSNLVIDCGTPRCPFSIPLVGGAQPLLEISPNVASYQSTAGIEQCRDITLSNTGDALLIVTNLSIASASEGTESVDDFFVKRDGCGPNVSTCNVDLRINAQINDTIDSEVVQVCYQNNDTSFADAANLRVTSNDPSAIGGVREISLQAEDQPCLDPENIDAQLFPSNICSGGSNTIDLGVTANSPGGVGGNGELAVCTFRILSGFPFPFNPSESVPR
ncbi:MAG: hypothetical protein HC923_06595, partial [Myxococcales bacterium]|nr:hypothetical protein [Myxococcales bacterium]